MMEKCEDHGESGACADLEDELDGEQRDDREGNGTGRGENPGQIAHPRPDHREVGIQGMGVDHRGYGVGSVVETVDEFKAQCDEQRQNQQRVGPHAAERDAAEVLRNVEADVADANDQREEHDGATDHGMRLVHLLFKQSCGGGPRRNCGRQIGHGVAPNVGMGSVQRRLGKQSPDSAMDIRGM
jgi:hypothetical protein